MAFTCYFLFIIVPIDRKEAIEDDVFPHWTPMKKGNSIVYVIYSMRRMEIVWGKDCMEFSKER